MGFAKFNKSTQKFNVSTKGLPYKTLKQLAEETGLKAEHKIRAIYINNKSLYGENPVIVTGNICVNLPNYLTEDIKEMMNDPEAVDYIKNGNAGFKIREYQAHGKTCYTVEWIDM